MTEQVADDGFFNDLKDVELGLKDGKYKCTIFKSDIVINKKSGAKAWVLTFKVQEGTQKGEQIQEWFNSYPEDADKQANALKWRARRLESLGVPESQWPSFKPSNVLGEDVYVTVKTNGQYTNVTNVELIKTDPLAAMQAGQAQASQPATQTVTQADVSSLM